MWRFAFLCSAVLTLTVACTDGPGAPSANTNEPSLAAGDPPPPPLDGGGRVTLFSGDELDATATVTQEGCVLPPSVIDIDLDGEYFQNKSENNARIHFTPVPGSGTGIIHETANNPDPNASGTLVVMVDESQLEIHVLDYVGLGTPPSSLFDFVLGDSFGSIFGNLDAEVMACGVKTAYTGVIRFSWGEGERL